MQLQLNSRHKSAGAPAPMRACVHDLRNLFAVVASARYLLERPSLKQDRAIIIEALGRVAAQGKVLTNALLSEGQDGAARGIEAAGELRSLEPLVRTLACRGLRIDLQTDDRPAWIRMTRSELEAVVLELVTNAKAAGARLIRIRGERRGERFWLAIADDGAGFRRTDPQTFGPSEGVRGNGMSRIAAALRSALGDLRIRSTKGRGSVVALVLPTATAFEPVPLAA